MTEAPPERINIFRLEPGSDVLIPVFSGSGLHAGFPSPAMDYVQQTIDLNKLLIRNYSSTFITDVSGDSMKDAFISNPARLIVDRSEVLANRDIVIAVVNQEFMVRQYVKEAGRVTLYPRNRKYLPTPISRDMEFEIWGVVTQILIDPRIVGFYDRVS